MENPSFFQIFCQIFEYDVIMSYPILNLIGRNQGYQKIISQRRREGRKEREKEKREAGQRKVC